MGHPDLDYFIENYASDPAFDLFDKPVVIWSGTWEFTRNAMAGVTATAGQTAHPREREEPRRLSACCRHFRRRCLLLVIRQSRDVSRVPRKTHVDVQRRSTTTVDFGSRPPLPRLRCTVDRRQEVLSIGKDGETLGSPDGCSPRVQHRMPSGSSAGTSSTENSFVELRAAASPDAISTLSPSSATALARPISISVTATSSTPASPNSPLTPRRCPAPVQQPAVTPTRQTISPISTRAHRARSMSALTQESSVLLDWRASPLSAWP